MRKKLAAAIISLTAAMYSITTTAMIAFADDTSSSTTSTDSTSTTGCSTSYIVMMAILLIVMYFMLIRPQKKKEKETKSLQDSVQVSDEIVTIGGIVGLVVKVGDDNVVIETGGDRHRIRIKKWAISENTTAKEKADAEVAKQNAEKKSLFGRKKKDNPDEE